MCGLVVVLSKAGLCGREMRAYRDDADLWSGWAGGDVLMFSQGMQTTRHFPW